MARELVAAIGLLLTAAMIVPATAATPKAGRWSGETEQLENEAFPHLGGLSIKFRVGRGGAKVKKVRFTASAHCTRFEEIVYTKRIKGKFPVVDGHFKAENRNGSALVKGRFKTKRKARGTLESWRFNGTELVLVPGRGLVKRKRRCKTGTVEWTAER
jgi:hypothetical protein